MSLSADIEFQVLAEELAEGGGPPPLGEFTDTVVITNGVDKIEVPLRAQLPVPRVEFNKVLDLGLVLVKTVVGKPLRLFNAGARPAKWSLSFDAGVPLTATPNEGLLVPTPSALAIVGVPSIRRASTEDDDNESGSSQGSSIAVDSNYIGPSSTIVEVRL